MNTGKLKVMFGCRDRVEEIGKWPCVSSKNSWQKLDLFTTCQK